MRFIIYFILPAVLIGAAGKLYKTYAGKINSTATILEAGISGKSSKIVDTAITAKIYLLEQQVNDMIQAGTKTAEKGFKLGFLKTKIPTLSLTTTNPVKRIESIKAATNELPKMQRVPRSSVYNKLYIDRFWHDTGNETKELIKEATTVSLGIKKTGLF